MKYLWIMFPISVMWAGDFIGSFLASNDWWFAPTIITWAILFVFSIIAAVVNVVED